MNRIIAFLTVFLLNLNVYSQKNLYVLHPLVGDTIDKIEKIQYMLFQEIADSNFRHCYLTFSDGEYFVNTCTLNGSIHITQVDSSLINRYKVNIEKLNQYYLTRAKNDTGKIDKKMSIDDEILKVSNTNDKILTPNTKDKILNDIRNTNRLNNDAERAKNFKQGTDIWGNSPRIEFHRKKK